VNRPRLFPHEVRRNVAGAIYGLILVFLKVFVHG
jgi:hypothetical protein